MSSRRVMVPLNENGRRIGEGHPRARLSDEIIDRMFHLREEQQLSFRCVAVEVGMPKSTAQSILTFRTRGQWPERFKRIDRTHDGKAAR